MYVGGHVLLQVLQGVLQAFGKLYGARVGLLGDCQQYGGLALLGSQSEARHLRANLHVGDVGQRHGVAAYALHHGVAHLLHVFG